MFPEDNKSSSTLPETAALADKPVTPVDAGSSAPLPASTVAPPKKNKTKLIVLLSVLGVLLLTGIGVLVWFLNYLSSDSKILGDALNHTLVATEGSFNGEISIKSKSLSSSGEVVAKVKAVSGTVDGQGVTQLDLDAEFKQGVASLGVGASLVITEKGDIYIQARKLKDLLALMGVTPSVTNGIDLGKLSDRWIRISADFVDQLLALTGVDAKYSEMMSCAVKEAKSVTTDKAVRKQLANVFTESRFFTATRQNVEDVDGKKAIKYSLSFDKDYMYDFSKLMNDSDYSKSLAKCFGNLADNSNDTDASLYDIASSASSVSIPNVNFDFWIDKSSHKPVKFVTKMSESGVDMTVDFAVNFDQVEAPKIPTDYTDIEKVFTEMFGMDLIELLKQASQYANSSSTAPKPSDLFGW
jgi:hypothetical protein